MIRKVLAGWLALSAGGFAGPGRTAAQEGVRVTVSPHVGVVAPQRDIGGAAPAEGAWFRQLGRVESAPSLGLAGELEWPASPVAVRATALHTAGASARGFFHCYPGLACPSILLPAEPDVGILAVVADAVWRLRRTGQVRPYGLIGAGVKRYAYTWPDAVALVDAGSHTETSPTVHVGAGVTIDLGRTAFWLELGDLWSGSGGDIGPGLGVPAQPAPGRGAQHDLRFTVGWRLLHF